MEICQDDRMRLQQIEKLLLEMMTPLNERSGSKVFFYRIIGCDKQNELLTHASSLEKKIRSLDDYMIWDTVIPLSNDQKLIEKIKKVLDPVSLKDYNNGALLNVLEGKSFFSIVPDAMGLQRIREAFAIVLNLYMLNDQPKNINIAINFVTKMLLWFSDFGKLCSGKSLFNPKIFYWGSPKTHEVYFLIVMFLLGCDVLVINTAHDDRFEKVDQENHFCQELRLSEELPVTPFLTRKTSTEPVKKDSTAVQLKTTGVKKSLNIISKIAAEPSIVVKLKSSDNPFADVLIPLSKRSGYSSGQFPILPALFVRYIGVSVSSDDWEAEYYNNLYNLDRTLQYSGHYLRFEDGVPAPTPAESSLIPEEFAHITFENREDLLETILKAHILPQINVPVFNNTIKQSFVDTVTLFSERQPHLTPSILLNFSLKLVVWINRYIPRLLAKGNSTLYNGEGDIFNDSCFKILFYGSIKLHEVYLLIFFHRVGSDVLFVHPELEGDTAFASIDDKCTLTQLIKNSTGMSVSPFPLGERLIRKSTIAYNASREIEEVIYSEDVGLYKPWQFEHYLTQPITLKTTYDELKILWSEPAKIRAEFKVQNKKVYVPNLFAKINGVTEDLTSFWQDIKSFSLAPNTLMIKVLPFSKVNYTRQELYQADYLFNEEGYVDEEKVIKSQHYKFGYLRTSLQQFIIAKINELLFSNMLLLQIDERMKLKILMTILTMDDSLIKLIETFDFPQEIPKIIVYDRNKESFSEFDAITLAFLNLVGLDILILTPTKYNTLEQLIKPNLFDVFQLPVVKYDLNLPELQYIASSGHKQSFLSRFFNNDKS
ncbi:hypothetical protein Desaci_2351 [Desulfosporosinus acidiphilus SJ4]|uniref:Putative component of 'biosynthetic module' domain-containing protein n=1 Tax=Desulfosporosinus acidiphilus (strain DSM 22704 / JCM 16185 / SJ4) TaxID=646529 RepID=I4D680_DESAJ|nr:YceG family protein [Desulfosporosinus acidiphilus]AFM41304.1 hypothetical protein Desaci_2351 [Desulfosporosinus acidiphilus SJ4]